MQDDGFKMCPFCAEKIRKEAVKCRFCGEWLEKKEQAPTGPSFAEKAAAQGSVQRESPTTDESKGIQEMPRNGAEKAPSEALICPRCKLINPPEAVQCDCGYGFRSGKIRAHIEEKAPSRIFNWIGAVLSTICGLYFLFVLARVNWRQLTPIQAEALVKGAFGLVVFLFVTISSASSARKGYKLFTFSLLLACCTAYIFDARQKAQARTEESNRIEVDNINSLEKYVQGGAAGDVPEFKPTGDPDTDSFFQVTRGLWTEYVQAYRTAQQKLEALQETDVFSDGILTNKPVLESEIQKRIAGQQIIEQFATSVTPMLDRFEKKCTSLTFSSAYKTNLVVDLPKAFSQLKPIFASWTKIQKTEQDYLQFLDENFEDYELKDGKILFGSQTNVQKYAELAKMVQDANSEAEEFQKRSLAAMETAKSKLQ